MAQTKVKTKGITDTNVTNAKLGTDISAAKLTAGTVATARLGSGTASSSTFLRGDQTYAAPSVSDIAWQSVVTGATLTAVAGRGYPINTTSNACTVTLPASASVGDQIIFSDYLRTWGTNAVTINPNSLKFQGYTTPQPEYDTDGETVHIVYMDATQGWIPINDGAVALETPQTYAIDFLVVAGGGGGGSGGDGEGAGGGGAGGYRTSTQTINTGTAITVTVGDGGAGGDNDAPGTVGDPSSISGSGVTTISSAGGGYGAGNIDGSGRVGGTGGNGGGSSAYYTSAGGSGDTPDTTPDQGNDGGVGYPGGSYAGGGGGGIGGAGAAGTSTNGGNGGAGVSNSISGSATDYNGGGGGGTHVNATAAGTATHGGGAGGDGAVGSNATVNTGGGGGGAGGPTTNEGGNGGKGVVVISVPDANYSGTTTGSPTVATGQAGSKTTMVFTGTGSYTT